MNDWERYSAVARRCATEVGGGLLERRAASPESEKRDGSLVTAADRWADETLSARLREAFPSHGVLSEEFQQTFGGEDWCWVIDPIDGTTNFARGAPLWTVSLGLLHAGVPVYGCVHCPMTGETFEGRAPGLAGLPGETRATLDGRPIRVAPVTQSRNQLFALCTRSSALAVAGLPYKTRMFGSATYQLVSVASGGLVGALEATPKVWDLAGPRAILAGAGAAWIPLGERDAFPLEAGVDYTTRGFSTLVLADDSLRAGVEPAARAALGP